MHLPKDAVELELAQAYAGRHRLHSVSQLIAREEGALQGVRGVVTILCIFLGVAGGLILLEESR